MKRLFFLAAIALQIMIFSSCTNNNTPSNVCEKALQYIQKGDYSGYIDLIKFSEDSTVQDREKYKKELSTILEEKLKEDIEAKKGIKEYKVLEEIIDGDSAKVKYQIIWGNDEITKDEMKLTRNEEGKWMLNDDK